MNVYGLIFIKNKKRNLVFLLTIVLNIGLWKRLKYILYIIIIKTWRDYSNVITSLVKG